MIEKRYYTKGAMKNISGEDSLRVIGALERDYGDNSECSGFGRVYYLEKGKIEHRIGPQPQFIAKAEKRKDLTFILEKLGLEER